VHPRQNYDRPGWMRCRDYCDGMICNWGTHLNDIAQWGLGMDESGPVEILPPDGKDAKRLTYKYANGITMTRDGQVRGPFLLPARTKC
jgi:hypothetical protein